MYITKKLLLFAAVWIISFSCLLGCTAKEEGDQSSQAFQTPNRLISLSLDAIGFSLEEQYGEQSASLYPAASTYQGIRQMDADLYASGGADYSPKAPGNYTYITTSIIHRADLDKGEIDIRLMSLRAYKKANMEDSVVQINYKDYSFEELSPYLLFETDEYAIYDFMFFESDETFEAFAEREYRLIFEHESNLKYNPEYAEYDYVKLQVDVRNWLIEQIKQDYPLP